jgi:hypothetical protein
VATSLLELSTLSVAEARNAYSAVCLLPGFDPIRFSPLFKNLKRTWNHSVQKYATFWDPEPVLRQMITTKSLQSMTESELRGRLIMLFRLLALNRGIDLERTQRTVSVVHDSCFVLVRRKGWLTPKWEEVIKNDDFPCLSPFHVLKEYVRKTAHFAPPGGPLLWSLDHRKALTSNTINSLTKDMLKILAFQFPTGQRTARGEQVSFYTRS